MTHIKHKIPQPKTIIKKLPGGAFFEYDNKIYIRLINHEYNNAFDVMSGRMVILPESNEVVYYTDVDILVGNEWEKNDV